MTKPRVVPWTSTVTRITAKAATSIKSRPGIVAGTLNATASVTTPRMPAQLITLAAREPMVSAPRQPARFRNAMTASEPKIQAKRASVTAATIAATGQAMCSSTTPIPPTRWITPRSDKPISMNTPPSSRKIITCQNERPRTRMLAAEQRAGTSRR